MLHNKRFKRDSQRVEFLLCVGFCGYGVMRKLGSSVVSPLSGRYATYLTSSINKRILSGSRNFSGRFIYIRGIQR